MLIDRIKELLLGRYTFPDVAQRMVNAVRKRQCQQEYLSITDPARFAERLTHDLQDASHDKHIQVRFSARALPEDRAGQPGSEEQARMRTILRETNFGFEQVQRLPGNVGYLDLREFGPADLCGETLAAAMNFLANTDALIIDLRENQGGDPAMVALVSSYLFGSNPVHLNDLHWRDGNRLQEFWTQSAISGSRYGERKPVYLLTSAQTFSAGEEFAYDLKALHRATIVGENTGGGANPGRSHRISDHFSIFIPNSYAVNPVTGTNWQDVGVQPDIQASASVALKVAHLAAMKEVIQAITDEQLKAAIERQIGRVQDEITNSSKP